MSEPIERNPNITALLDVLIQNNTQDCIRRNVCVMCDKSAVDFDDDISRREYTITGLCQACQNIAFAEDGAE